MPSIEANLSTASVKDWVSCSTGRHACTKDNGRPMPATVEVWNATPMETDMKVSSSTVNLTEKAYIRGPTAKCTRVNGHSASRKAKASGRASSVTRTSESGASRKPQATVSISGKMVIGTKVNGTIV